MTLFERTEKGSGTARKCQRAAAGGGAAGGPPAMGAARMGTPSPVLLPAVPALVEPLGNVPRCHRHPKLVAPSDSGVPPAAASPPGQDLPRRGSPTDPAPAPGSTHGCVQPHPSSWPRARRGWGCSEAAGSSPRHRPEPLPARREVLKVKYYCRLCCCLTTTDKLRTSCQNVSAQQINIQNESQHYVVYN